jgi:ArsR family transcriptional regulator, virulence genes transcriptional regulator
MARTQTPATATAIAPVRGRMNGSLDAAAMLKNAANASDFLKALSHKSRLAILCLLIDGEKTVSEIEELLKLRQPAVSQQFARLREDNLVKVRRVGKSVHYSIARPEVVEIISALHRSFCR